MYKAFKAYQAGKITREEMYKFQDLKGKLFGGDSFVVPSPDNKDLWKEYDQILNKIN